MIINCFLFRPYIFLGVLFLSVVFFSVLSKMGGKRERQNSLSDYTEVPCKIKSSTYSPFEFFPPDMVAEIIAWAAATSAIDMFNMMLAYVLFCFFNLFLTLLYNYNLFCFFNLFKLFMFRVTCIIHNVGVRIFTEHHKMIQCTGKST